jgi:leucyl-tRNA synthetase
LYDLGIVVEQEPFKKLVNQGMIQGRSNFVYRIKDTNTFVSKGLKDNYATTPIRVDINLVQQDSLQLDTEGFRKWRPDFATAEFVLEDGKYICGAAVEKMSKSMFNVVNPDDIVERYGADTLRMYEMFLGPIEQSKPWDTNGIDGVSRFLRKLWALMQRAQGGEPTADELKIAHKLIKKVTTDIEQFSFNTSVAAFMIAVNELSQIKNLHRNTMELITRVISPFAPHMAEEFWHELGHDSSVTDAEWPQYNEEYLKESTVKYAVSFNGKTRFTMEVPAGTSKEETEKLALSDQAAQKWLDGKTPRKVIVVPNKIVNIVI